MSAGSLARSFPRLVGAILGALQTRAPSPRQADGVAPICQNAPVPGDPVVERAILAELAEEIGQAEMGEVLNTFFSESERRLAVLRQLSWQADREAIRTEAHTLKSSAATFGFQQLAGLARTLEHPTPEFEARHYADMIDGMEAAFARIRPALAAKEAAPA